jgi:hypothetical protein
MSSSRRVQLAWAAIVGQIAFVGVVALAARVIRLES